MSKRMRASLAITGGLVCAAAQAQDGGAAAQGAASPLTARIGASSSVTLYGLIEATVSDVTNTTASGARKLGFQAPWFSGSRLGFTGKHAFDDDLAGIFKLEAEYLPQNGAMTNNNVLFNRDAWAGFQSRRFGKLTFGRQNALGRDISAIYGDPYGGASVTTGEGGYSNQNNFKNLVFYGGSATGTRMDNGIVWKKAWSEGLVAGLGFQFGSTAGNLQRGQTKSAALGYNLGAFHVAGFYTDADVAGHADRVYSVGANYQWPTVRVGGGWYHYSGDQAPRLQGRRDNAFTAHVRLTPTPLWDFTLGYVQIEAKHAAVDASGNVLNPFADPGASTSLASGDRDTIYGAAMMHLDKSSDLYVAADHLRMTGGYRASGAPGSTTQNELAVGLRYKF
ncbi:MAG TPA: porin [Burkholderiaceae bacterium]